MLFICLRDLYRSCRFDRMQLSCLPDLFITFQDHLRFLFALHHVVKLPMTGYDMPFGRLAIEWRLLFAGAVFDSQRAAVEEGAADGGNPHTTGRHAVI